MTLRGLIQGGLFVSLGVVLPLAFHAVGLGPVFLPMFYPLLIAGFILNPKVAILVGILTPALSHLLTQSPPIFLLPMMTLEALLLTGLPGLSAKKNMKSVVLTLVITLILDRVLVFILVRFLAGWLNLPADFSATSAVLFGLPGLAAILVVVPAAVALLRMVDSGGLVHEAP